MRWVIAYDIADDSRRTRVAAFLEGWGRRVQKSVFECELSSDELSAVRERLRSLVMIQEDRVHLYRQCAACGESRVAMGQDLEPSPSQAVVI